MDRHEKLHLEVVDGKELGKDYFQGVFNFYEMIKATVHDSNAEGVEDILVTFVIERGPEKSEALKDISLIAQYW